MARVWSTPKVIIGVAAASAVVLILCFAVSRWVWWVPDVADWSAGPPPDAALARSVEVYLQDTRQWPRTSYRLELERREGEALMVSVVHEDDIAAWKKRPHMGGGGKSFKVEVQELRVVREWGWQ